LVPASKIAKVPKVSKVVPKVRYVQFQFLSRHSSKINSLPEFGINIVPTASYKLVYHKAHRDAAKQKRRKGFQRHPRRPRR
jgi:hypothetical protein